MMTLDELVKLKKVRAIGASAMYEYQFRNMQVIAKKLNLTKFSVMQNYYNLLYREDERELIPICKQYNVALVPYSPLAGGHLTHLEWNGDSLRSETDKNLKSKYDDEKENDLLIINCVHDLAIKYNVSMAQISLAWLFKKGVSSAIVGGTKIKHIKDAIESLNVKLTDNDVKYLEELYKHKPISGARPQGL